MFVLIGHGYVGQKIKAQLDAEKASYFWISHNDPIPKNARAIINAAGFTGKPNVDACEIYKQETIDGNVIFPVALERANPNTPIIHISSGCVYNGYPEGGYTELDAPNFTFNNGSFYSGAKALAQEMLMPYMNKSYLFRIRLPFCAEHTQKNLLTKYENYSKLIDVRNSLSCMEDIAKLTVHFGHMLPKPGIYNACNPGSMTTREIVDIMGLSKEYFTDEEFQSVIKAPRSNCVLNTDKISKIYPLPDIREAMVRTVKQYMNT
jgi:dTDP-4-dehydrorhamnose reductase